MPGPGLNPAWVDDYLTDNVKCINLQTDNVRADCGKGSHDGGHTILIIPKLSVMLKIRSPLIRFIVDISIRDFTVTPALHTAFYRDVPQIVNFNLTLSLMGQPLLETPTPYIGIELYLSDRNNIEPSSAYNDGNKLKIAKAENTIWSINSSQGHIIVFYVGTIVLTTLFVKNMFPQFLFRINGWFIIR